MSQNPLLTKPKLRGYIHQEAFFISLGASILLVAKSTTRTALVGSIIYSFGLLLLFGISASYHRPHWEPRARALMKRIDHCAIFILIAGTFTPIALLALPTEVAYRSLLVMWIAALAGILQSIFWVRAPKWLTVLFYVATGWSIAPYLRDLRDALGNTKLSILAAGGLVYTVGAVFYAMKRPNPIPGIFGYHELFHLFTIVGATLHFVVVYQLVS